VLYAVDDEVERLTRELAVAEGKQPDGIQPTDALVYCNVCHKTHAVKAGERMCGGKGSWVAE
jgi:hypothetical protein